MSTQVNNQMYKGVTSMCYRQAGMYTCQVSACGQVCEFVALFFLLLWIGWTESIFQVVSHLLGHPVHLWCCTGCLA